MKVLTGQLPLVEGSVRLGDTVRVGYYEQTGLNITADQEDSSLLKFVQEAVERGMADRPAEGLKDVDPQFVVESAGNMGRRKSLAGKEAGVSVQIATSSSSSAQTAGFSEREAMTLLKRFQFSSKRWYDRVGQLSGGERRRLQLLQILAKSPNVLLLDEPSNDLGIDDDDEDARACAVHTLLMVEHVAVDLSTLAALEEYLTETFEGCLVVVSHDNFFMNRVAEHLFVFQGDGVVRDFQGSYTDYLEFRRDEKADAKLNSKALANRPTIDDQQQQQSMDEGIRQTDATTDDITSGDNRPVAAAEGTPTTTPIPAALSFNERKEFKKLEKEVVKLGVQIEQLEDQIATGSSRGEGYSVLNEWTTQLQKLKMQLEDKELRWIELAEK